MTQYLYKDVARLAKDVVNLRDALSDVRRLYHPALRHFELESLQVDNPYRHLVLAVKPTIESALGNTLFDPEGVALRVRQMADDCEMLQAALIAREKALADARLDAHMCNNEIVRLRRDHEVEKNQLLSAASDVEERLNLLETLAAETPVTIHREPRGDRHVYVVKCGGSAAMDPDLRTCLELLMREEVGTTNSHNNALPAQA